MPETEEITISILRAKEPITVKTHRRIVITIKSAPCRLIEMEDVLFHLDSAVIMPENPEGKSSSQGSSDERQLRVSGVRALSLVFRQLQLHPEQKLLICGHADRSGKTAYNFELSALRAQGVYLLLCGKRSEWAKLAESKHRIEDYQQIMKYYALVNGWICDPGAIDNTWGPKTERAIKEFIFSWNTSFNHKAPGAQKLDMAIVNQIRNSSSHAWPQALWEAVYDLYEHDLITAAFGANVPKDKIESLRSQIVKSFVDPQRPWVACGESFPKDAHPGVNYRSQTDRRVEILFFDADELPILNCPEQTASVHTAKECPLRRGNCFTFEYIDPSTYFTAEYHLKFEYYDRIKKQRLPVQVAFPIAAWKEGSIALQSKVVLGKDGILTVTVSGITHSPREDDIYFTFETPEQYYLFTESSTSDPVLITESQLVSQLQAERDALPPDKQASAPLTFAQLPFERRRHYYDLPKKWDSRNWFCRKGIAEGVWKEVAVQETTASEPICFSFDDVVLFTEHNGVLQPVQWKESYRFSAFSSTMEVNYPDPDRPWFTLGTSPRNLLSYFITGEDLRAIALCGRFYDITTRRTVKGDIVGVRAAILDDQTVHVSERRREPVAEDCGHYDLHYFSECTDKDGKACSVLLVHWIAHLEKGTGNVTEWDLDKFRHKGFSGCKERWEKKGYWLEPENDPAGMKIKVIPRYFFEENTQVAKPHCIIKIHDSADTDYRSSMGLDSADFAKDTFREDSTEAGVAEDNNTFRWFTMAHELGHATGLDDEYIEPVPNTGWLPVLPKFEQYYDGMPYSADINSIMVVNRSPRLRHLWIQCRWLNENAKVRTLTRNTVFRVRHLGVQGGKTHDFKYYLPPQTANFYKPVYEEKNVKNGANGKFDLFLYRLGQDEMTKREYVKLVPNQSDFDGILVVRVNIVWFFKNHTGNGNNQWITDDSKIKRMRNFQRSILDHLNKRYWMEKISPDNNLSKIYIYFLPHHQFEGAVGPSAHFRVTVRADNPINGDSPTEHFSGSDLTVGNRTNNIAIFRYMLGINYKNPDGSFINTVSAEQLDFLKKWVENKTGSSYGLHE